MTSHFSSFDAGAKLPGLIMLIIIALGIRDNAHTEGNSASMFVLSCRG